MRFEAGNVSTLTPATADTPLIAIRAPVGEGGRLRELGITLQAATATQLGLARATTVSVTPGTTKPGRAAKAGTPAAPLPDSGILLVSSWVTVPVISTNYLRQACLPATIGAFCVWYWPADGALEIGDGEAISELVIANLVAVAPSLFRYWAVWEN
jgi:hypothetical protein